MSLSRRVVTKIPSYFVMKLGNEWSFLSLHASSDKFLSTTQYISGQLTSPVAIDKKNNCSFSTC